MRNVSILSAKLFTKNSVETMMRKRDASRKRKGVNKVWSDAKTANVVGLQVSKLRRERGLTQEQLAAKCQLRGLNLSRGTLAKIEARVRFIKACELFIIALILKVPMEDFYPPDFGGRASGG
jgi:DNA-binding XRE family transcriptional regulator